MSFRDWDFSIVLPMISKGAPSLLHLGWSPVKSEVGASGHIIFVTVYVAPTSSSIQR